MSMQLTFTGETFKDVLAQMAAVAIAASAGSAVDMATAAGIDVIPITREAEVEPKTETPNAPEVDPPQAALPQTAVDVLSPADIAKLKEKALEKVRDVYASGAEGQAKVNKLTVDFGVKKLGKVPDERVQEFYEKAMGL